MQIKFVERTFAIKWNTSHSKYNSNRLMVFETAISPAQHIYALKSRNRFHFNTSLILKMCFGQCICFFILFLSISGTCKCDENYTAADCSMNENDPPILDGVNVADGGLCDTEHCSSAFVEGDLFLDTPHLTCKMRKFQARFFTVLIFSSQF